MKFHRLGISYPELTAMQVRAIFQAAILLDNQGVTVLPEIMVPLIGTPQVYVMIVIFFVVPLSTYNNTTRLQYRLLMGMNMF